MSRPSPLARSAPDARNAASPAAPHGSAAAAEARIGIDAHGVSELRTGISTYLWNLIGALARVAPAEAIALYLHTLPPEPLPFPIVRVPPAPLWTTLRLGAHFLARRPPPVMLYPAHSLPLYSPARNVVTVHDLAYELFPEHFRWVDRQRLRRTTRRAADNAHHIIAVSASARDDLVRFLGVPEERVSVVHEAYDAEHFRPPAPEAIAEVRRRYGLRRPYIVAVGTLQSRKNHVTLIRSMRILRARGHDVDLVVAGAKGWLFNEIFAEVAELGLREHVHFLGYVPYADLPPLYGGATAGALVSLYEGFGIPVLEGMACGIPMLVSNVSSLPEVGGDAVLTVPPLDTEAVADALDRLISDSALRAALLARAPENLRRFSWDRTARATLDILNQMA